MGAPLYGPLSDPYLANAFCYRDRCPWVRPAPPHPALETCSGDPFHVGLRLLIYFMFQVHSPPPPRLSPRSCPCPARCRYIHKAGDVGPVAVLKEFWEEQEAELPGVFSSNTLSKL